MRGMTIEKARGIRRNLEDRVSNPDSVLGGWVDSGPKVYAEKRRETVAWASRELERCTKWIEAQESKAARQPEARQPSLCGSCFTMHNGECL